MNVWLFVAITALSVAIGVPGAQAPAPADTLAPLARVVGRWTGTYVFAGADQFEEIFEIAEPGKDFEVYSRTRLTRVR